MGRGLDWIKDKAEDVGKYVAPVPYYGTKALVTAGRRLTGTGGGRSSYKPQPQYWGGSEEKYLDYQGKYDRGVENADRRVTGGLLDAEGATQRSAGRSGMELERSKQLAGQQGDLARRSQFGFDRAAQDYRASRGQTLQDADAIRQQSMGLEDSYRRTADRMFGINQDRNMRALQSAAASGGNAGSLREAMATAGEANANAAAQAEVTRANEFNALKGMQLQGLQSSANIRQGVGAQDQSMAGLQSGRQVGALGAQESLINQRTNIFGAQADRELTAAGMGTQAGLAQQGNYLAARTGMERDMLGAQQNAENQRQNWQRQEYTYRNYPLAMFNTPA